MAGGNNYSTTTLNASSLSQPSTAIARYRLSRLRAGAITVWWWFTALLSLSLAMTLGLLWFGILKI